MKKPKIIQIAYSANSSDVMPTVLTDDGRIFKWIYVIAGTTNGSWVLQELTPILPSKS